MGSSDGSSHKGAVVLALRQSSLNDEQYDLAVGVRDCRTLRSGADTFQGLRISPRQVRILFGLRPSPMLQHLK